MKVEEVMKKIIVTENDIKISEASKIMKREKIGSLVFIKNNKILGIITEKDIVDNIDKAGSRISSVMNKNVLTIDEKESLEHAAEFMAEHKIKRLPVTSKGRLAGIITASEIIENVDDLNEEFYFD